MSKFQNILPQNRNGKILWLGFIIIAFLIGWMMSSSGPSTPEGQNEHNEVEASIWTCSMHPNIQQPSTGQCPICGMDLIPVKTDIGGDLGPRQIQISENARKLAEIEVATVERKRVNREIRLVGKVDYDETRLGFITAWVPGRIDRRYVNYTGSAVKKGDPIIEIYSPELLSTQQELIESLKTVDAMKNSQFPEMKQSAQQQLEAVRERLRLWGLTKNLIATIEKNRKVTDHIQLNSPLNGIVVHMNALEGSYVKTGSKLYTIADLSKVWVKMDAYESDLSWIKNGQKVEFQAEAYPGEIFMGKIAFIDPVLNTKTRTVKIRVNVNNPNGKLKPEMFVHGIIKSEVTLGQNQRTSPLVIPASAPLITGKRAVVYVAVDNRDGVYEGREIELGPRAGNYYLVKAGLIEGERVVKKGAFKIDSAIQIQAKPSMMNPKGGSTSSGHQHGATPPNPSGEEHQEEQKEVQPFANIPVLFKKQIDEVYTAYFDVQDALSHDQDDAARDNVEILLQALKNANMSLLKGDAHMKWMEVLENLQNAGKKLKESKDIQNARKAFDILSQSIIGTAKQFGSDDQNLFVYHCPMAFDNRGADWLQNKEGTENPYFGSQMFTCGSQIADLTTKTTEEKQEGHKHE